MGVFLLIAQKPFLELDLLFYFIPPDSLEIVVDGASEVECDTSGASAIDLSLRITSARFTHIFQREMGFCLLFIILV